MASRLDRLFVLIETGTSPVTRKAASQQLGEVVKYHSYELQPLLDRILNLLYSTSWDTRIAAVQAIEAICNNTPEWIPSRKNGKNFNEESKKLSFSSFDMHSVMLNSSLLMASENVDFMSVKGEDCKELVNQQVELINRKLNMGICAETIVSNDDISASLQSSTNTEIDNKKMVSEVLELNNEYLTHRDMSRVKRKAKQMYSKQLSDDFLGNSSSCGDGEQISDLDPIEDKRLKIDDSKETTIEPFDEESQWPFELFTSKLKQNLFSPNWEIRHGSACALREIMKLHGKSAGYTVDEDENRALNEHQSWLEDLTLHLLCVIALDRFGDFISDQVIAPVRETCAQCLGIVCNLMDRDRILQVVNILMYLLEVSEWEVRHGALLGIKYLLAVREDLQDDILCKVFPLILNCFGDPIDDVSAEAASALTPVCAKIVKIMPESVPTLIHEIWKLLSNQDDLGVACNNLMGLLASLFMHSETETCTSSDIMAKIVPYLWVFLNYNTTSVRKAALQTICSMTLLNSRMKVWNETLIQNTMRHIFQRILLESNRDIRLLTGNAWDNIVKTTDVEILKKISFQFFGTWIWLCMQSPKTPFDESFFLFEKDNHFCKNDSQKTEGVELKLYLGGNETVLPEIRENNVIEIRCMSARMLGHLLTTISQSSADTAADPMVECYSNILLMHLNSKSAYQRMIASLVISEWARLSPCPKIIPNALKDRLQQILLESIYFDEIAMPYTKILQDTKDYINILKEYVPIDASSYNKVLRINEIESLTRDCLLKSGESKIPKKTFTEMQEKRQSIYSMVCIINNEQNTLTVTTQAIIAGAVLNSKCLSDKLNPVIKPLMDAIKKEDSDCLQELAAFHLAEMVNFCIDRQPCPNAKIVTNLCSLLCSDSEFTPKIHSHACKNKTDKDCTCDKNNGILTLINQQKTAERLLLAKKSSGRTTIPEVADEDLFDLPCGTLKSSKIQRQGSTFALIKIVQLQGQHLREKIPVLWDHLYTNIINFDPAKKGSDEKPNENETAEKLIRNLQVLEVVCPHLHSTILPDIIELLVTLCDILCHSYCAVRHMAARCIAAIATRDIIAVMKKVISLILPLVNAADSVIKRQGGVEAITALTESLQLNIIPYIVLLIIPLLGRMSDQDDSVRSMASHTFGVLIQLMPLDTNTPAPADLPSDLKQSMEQQRSFLNQLLNPKCIPDFKVPVQINAELRSYQQCGVNWLAFLNKYSLHGILCDDMGLGKTLQSLCILVADHFEREKRYKKNKSADSTLLPSLVICPPTLIGHWIYEIKKFIPSQYMNPLQYEGIPTEREKLRNAAHHYNLIVASYDIVRKDVDFFSNFKWNYCILDEGHIIKNGKTKVSRAIKQLTANHRLILSGTPIQNNVLELWSLFDFLMPGYLGNEKQFNAKFSKPILSSRDPKSSPKEQEAGVLAMETLHQKVLPFILRRMKEDVLKDLPPKITQDYYCDLSPIQQLLYEDFSKSELQKNTINSITKKQSCNTFSMFQALRYLQSVCNHPKLVLTPQHPLYERVMEQLEEEKSSLSDIKHAAKLIALKQLLLDCGIGGSTDDDNVVESSCIVSQHRALIFCQLKATLNILETDLLKTHLPNITYLRLDGSVSSNERHRIVTRFNNDPSIDLLLLTTQIGGLGLNLTGADTVIFVEHDWSPMKDLQAMDRAHRIGQKKVVNVYRLITKATLEQKIMGLQAFKLKTANTVITAENSSLVTMSTDKLLDLFSLNSNEQLDKKNSITSAESSKGNSINEYMKSLPELWDTKNYEEEYDLTSFVKSLKK
ncbi:TATA-binding protein-associated factor 172 isoform X2 [Planococcus citri]|uniref:TATA-binding protein-associated factor 172 isoform X2 n=1 Tax=Planococcus citri TaxID=170843 RepID=UPI0031FA01A7